VSPTIQNNIMGGGAGGVGALDGKYTPLKINELQNLS